MNPYGMSGAFSRAGAPAPGGKTCDPAELMTLLPFATPGELKVKAVEIMRIMGPNGGYIAAPTHAVPGDVPPENIAALIEVFQNQ